MLKPEKVNVVVGKWTDKCFYSTLSHHLPQFVPILNQKVLDLCFIDTFHGSMTVPDIDIAVVDWRHWYFDDATFIRYARELTGLSFRSIIVAELPFEHEKPNTDLYVFRKKVIERIKILCDVIKNFQPNTTIVAPALAPGDNHESVFDVLIECRNLFDVWNAHLCHDITEQYITLMSSMILQIKQVLPKPFWVTKWAVPAFEGPIISKDLTYNRWKSPSYLRASSQMKALFETIESTTKNDCHWFWGGCTKDFYNPESSPPDLYWTPFLYQPANPDRSWNSQHFLGLITHDNQMKTPLWDMFLSIAAKPDDAK